ncbi:type II toxin-antitoxin system prevent-host-death family antitoxin [Kineococcus sp. T13]|uniref:type II toxin-antitoxin system prevent-host-death family antitoxin n=1 Tax=Kineococcus vitellinus TaxID=2696565 RepID=UPI00141328B5|nr:type II toxin-antitoxin system prevent-host-death family antitoxin [Kineococcus vitellinus]
MKTIPVRDLRNEYGRVLREVEEDGETYTITNHGRAVAQISPVPQAAGPREGVPLGEAFGQLSAAMTTSDIDALKADLDQARWEPRDPFTEKVLRDAGLDVAAADEVERIHREHLGQERFGHERMDAGSKEVIARESEQFAADQAQFSTGRTISVEGNG